MKCTGSFNVQETALLVGVFWNQEQAMFDSEDDLLHFGSQVTAALQKLLDEWGVDGYSEKWGYPFPVEAHHELERAFALEQQRRATAK